MSLVLKNNIKRGLSLFIVLLAVITVMFTPSLAADPTYNPGDIAVINAIITNNGLNWTKANPADGSYVPSDWSGVTWSSGAMNRRITELDIYNKGLTGTLNVSGLTKLQSLFCEYNKLTKLDVSNLTNLQYIVCYYNNLTELDVSGLTKLQNLQCPHNLLTELDVSGLTNLPNLECSYNNLTELDVSGLTKLQSLFCDNNNLTKLALNATAPYSQISVQYNYLPNTSAITGRNISWDTGYFNFSPQKSGTAPVATPTITVSDTGLTFMSGVSGYKRITLTSATSGASIYYTMDGSSPTTSSTLYDDHLICYITTVGTYTIKAIAVKAGMANSGVASTTVTLSQVATPTITALDIIGGKRITITSATSGASIYYTTHDLTNPMLPPYSLLSTLYSGAFDITTAGTYTIRANAGKYGMVESEFSSISTFSLSEVVTPTITVSDVTGGKRITLTSTTSGASIYYTLDGATPTTSSTLYNSAFNITATGTYTIKAIAVKSGMTNSGVASSTVTVSQVATPTANPASGTVVTSGSTVTLATTTSGVTIYYTTNGTNPTTSSAVYSSPIAITGATTIKAMAVKAGMVNSGVATFNYTISSTSTYGITLNPSSNYTFSSATTGYSAQTPYNVTVNNTGNQPTGALTVALSGANAGNFTLSKTSITSIAVGGNNSFTVVPKTGLSAGTYTATVTVSNANVAAKSFTVSFTVNSSVPIQFTQNDRYSFMNTSSNFGSTYRISDSDFEKLCDYVRIYYSNNPGYANNLIKELQDSKERMRRNSKWEGSCYGMAATAILHKNNQINMINYVNSSASNLWGVLPVPADNPKLESAINYYHIAQNLGFIRSFTYFKGISAWSNRLERLIQDAKDRKLILFSYWWNKWDEDEQMWKKPGHAIVIYGYEAGPNGSHDLLAYDNRSPYKNVRVNISNDYQTCMIDGREDAIGVEFMSGTEMNIFDNIKIDGNVSSSAGNSALNGTDIRILGTQSVVVKNKAGQTLVYNAQTGAVSGTMSVLNQHMVVSSTSDGSPAPVIFIFTVADSDQFTFQTTGKGLDVSVMNSYIYASAESEKADTVIVAKNEGVSVLGSGTIDFSLSLGVNSSVCDIVSLNGIANQETSLKFSGAGALAEGNFNENTTLTVFSNISNVAMINVSSAYSKILVTEKAGEIDVRASSNGNGIFDVSVLDGVKVTGKVTSVTGDKRPATVVLKQNGNTVYTTQTNQNGEYVFNNVAAGNYTLVITKASYLSYTKTSLAVSNQNIAYKNVTLIPGDIDGDGHVSYNDFLKFLENYNKQGANIQNPAADINGDGYVDYNDFITFLSGYGKSAVIEP